MYMFQGPSFVLGKDKFLQWYDALDFFLKSLSNAGLTLRYIASVQLVVLNDMVTKYLPKCTVFIRADTMGSKLISNLMTLLR